MIYVLKRVLYLIDQEGLQSGSSDVGDDAPIHPPEFEALHCRFYALDEGFTFRGLLVEEDAPDLLSVTRCNDGLPYAIQWVEDEESCQVGDKY
jgi:hypothetical protein